MAIKVRMYPYVNVVSDVQLGAALAEAPKLAGKADFAERTGPEKWQDKPGNRFKLPSQKSRTGASGGG
jgi:hypothetical protein